MPSGANGLPEEGIAGGSLNKLQVCLLVPMACLQKAVLCWQTLCFASVSGPPAGWHMVQEPFQDMSTIATQSVANMSEVDQNEVDFSEL